MSREFSAGELDHFLAKIQRLITIASEIGPGLGDPFGLLPKNVMEHKHGAKG